MTGRVLRSVPDAGLLADGRRHARGAQEKLCLGQSKAAPPPTKEQKEQADLEDWAQQRAEFGFRHDIPYVQELVRRGVWEYDVGYIPVTRAENRYLKLRDELELGARAQRYLRAHENVDGGVSVEDDWPREPYLLLHLTRDVSKHLAAIRALAKYPRNLRAVKVRYSDKALDKIADRVWRDQEKLAAEGIHLTGTGHGSADALEVSVISARADVYDYFEQHYGDAVKVEVEAREEYGYECVDSSVYQIAPDGMSVTLFWEQRRWPRARTCGGDGVRRSRRGRRGGEGLQRVVAGRGLRRADERRALGAAWGPHRDRRLQRQATAAGRAEAG